MPPITFRASRRQRGYLIFFVIALGAMGVMGLALAHGGSAARGVDVGSAILIVIAVFLFLVLAAHVTIDAHGLRTWSVFSRRSFAWSEIEAIYSQWNDLSDGDWSERVRIEPFDGRAFDLPRPSNSNTTGGNPDYEQQVETIIEYWRTATSR